MIVPRPLCEEWKQNDCPISNKIYCDYVNDRSINFALYGKGSTVPWREQEGEGGRRRAYALARRGPDRIGVHRIGVHRIGLHQMGTCQMHVMYMYAG